MSAAALERVLEVRDLHVSYGAIEALKGVSLHMDEEEIVTLIGANGAGKSTTLRAIMGLVPAADGEIFFHGRPTREVPTHKLVREGLILVPEGRAIFANLSIDLRVCSSESGQTGPPGVFWPIAGAEISAENNATVETSFMAGDIPSLSFYLVSRQDHRSCRVNVEFSMMIFPWLSGTFTVIVYGCCHPIWITSWSPRTAKVPAFSGSSWAAAA